MPSFENIISKVQSSPTEKNIIGLIDYAKNGLSDENIVNLAKTYASSGEIIKNKSSHLTCDIASTGGPTSLSTLITPLILKSLGFVIPKLGVPGRPAGGIDILNQIKGYKIDPNLKQINEWLEKGKYVHFIGGDLYTPLDRKIFEIRKKHSALGISDLVIASILSKKIAVNLNYAGLDIRVSSFGNFGTTWREARKNAQRFIAVASRLDMQATCFLTNGNIPYQPFIGRGEALLGMLNIFENNAKYPSLFNHLEECYDMATSMTNIRELNGLNMISLRNLFKENIEMQGGNFEEFVLRAQNVEESHIHEIKSRKSGFLKISLERIRFAIVKIQANEATSKNLFPDPCGVILKKMPSRMVLKGEIICSFRCPEEYLDGFRNNLLKGLEISNERFIENQYEKIN